MLDAKQFECSGMFDRLESAEAADFRWALRSLLARQNHSHAEASGLRNNKVSICIASELT